MLEVWLAFSAGLVGSGHCLGMCGGIVTALAMSNRDATAAQRFMFNVLFHLGRIFTYTLLGFLIGSVAQAGMVDLLKPYVKWLFLLANIFVVVLGVCTAFGVRKLGLSALDGSVCGFFGKQLSRVTGSSSTLAAVPAGLLTGFLPCGLVYGVLITAATSGSALKGGSMMLAFGCGTLPVLLTYGQVASTISALGGGLFQRCMGTIVALLGILGVCNALVSLGLW